MNLYLTVIPACHVALTCCPEEKHGGGYLRCNCVFMFKITYCCFNFYSPFKVLFIADAKISFDSFRSSMTATVNSKTIITVNPGKRSQRHWQKHRIWHNYLLCNSSKTMLKLAIPCKDKKKSPSCCKSRILSVCCCPSHSYFALRHQRGQSAVQLR